jgi:Domain of unknown function (DUF4388)
MDLEARGTRTLAAKFSVAIEGLDPAPLPRKGDISTTGVYFETDREVGGVGTVQWLHLVSADAVRELRIMAYVVRKVVVSDTGGENIGGLAFEFVPESQESRSDLREFVGYVLGGDRNEQRPVIEPRLDASIARAAKSETTRASPASPARVRQLSVRSMKLETSWSIATGERVRIDIVAPGMTRRIRLEGRVVRVAPKPATDPPRYEIEVEVQDETERPLHHYSSMTLAAVRPEDEATAGLGSLAVEEISRTLDDLLSALILPPSEDAPRHHRNHMSGRLSQIHLPTLCSLFEMERLTGKLVLMHKDEGVIVYLRDGQLIDVEPAPPGTSPRTLIGRVLAWQDGTFELYLQAVNRPNRIGATTTALLLDLARVQDEASRD